MLHHVDIFAQQLAWTESLSNNTGSVKTDREALVALYNATDGENWNESDNWLSDAPLGEWEGVVTNDDGRITELQLHTNDLSGEIPPELGSLFNLSYLYLNDNDLSGEIPAELGSLSDLRALYLNNNALSGCVPSSLEDQLDLDYSELSDLLYCPTGTPSTTGSGNAPTATVAPGPAAATAPPAASGSVETDREALVALYNATDGENWNESDNWLSDAPLGEWEGVVTNDDGRVTELQLPTNDLSGEIPAWLGGLSNLTGLWLSGNELSGCVPRSLEDQLDFSVFDLGGLPYC